jgi:hypothetical protein
MCEFNMKKKNGIGNLGFWEGVFIGLLLTNIKCFFLTWIVQPTNIISLQIEPFFLPWYVGPNNYGSVLLSTIKTFKKIYVYLKGTLYP